MTVSVTTEAAARCVLVSVAGELDVATEGLFTEHLVDVLKTVPHGAALVLDFGALTFCSSAGVRAWGALATTAEHLGVPLWIGAVSAPVRRVFEIVGFGDFLPPRV